MNFASAINPCLIRRSNLAGIHGLTMVELLVALTVASIFLSGAYAAYIQIMSAQTHAESRIEAIHNGRSALTTLSTELKEINSHGEDVVFVGINGYQGFGDGIDNDYDGQIDEETVDGRDDDMGGSLLLVNDRHARLDTLYERPTQVNRTDLGDVGVDEDVLFGLDQLYISITPTEPSSDFTLKTVNYFISEYDGQERVLIRRTRIEKTSGAPLIAEAPLAFGVLGIDLLYWDWNPSGDAVDGYWVTEWDSRSRTGDARLPASIYLRLTLNADSQPGRTAADGDPLQSLILESIVNIESVIGSNSFNNQRPNL